MEEIIRIIETGYPFGGRLAHIYVFCLPPAAMSRLGEVLEQMRHMAPQGVEQFAGDDAGLLIYTREGVDNVATCLATLSVINLVLQTGLKLGPDYPGSFFSWTTMGAGRARQRTPISSATRTSFCRTWQAEISVRTAARTFGRTTFGLSACRPECPRHAF